MYTKANYPSRAALAAHSKCSHGLLRRSVFRDWLALRGIVHTLRQLHLLQLSPCATRNASRQAYGVKALSDINKLRSGLSLSWEDVATAPLWNGRLFTLDNKTVTCRYLIGRSVLRVRDVVDPDTWTLLLH